MPSDWFPQDFIQWGLENLQDWKQQNLSVHEYGHLVARFFMAQVKVWEADTKLGLEYRVFFHYTPKPSKDLLIRSEDTGLYRRT